MDAKVLQFPGRVPALTFDHGVQAWITAHTAAGAWSTGTAKKYRETFTKLGRELAGKRTATALSHLDTASGRPEFQAAFHNAFGALAPATRARHLSTVRSAAAWWIECGWLATDPTTGWPMAKLIVDRTRALSRADITSLWALEAPLRDKTLWKLLYESCARAEEVLRLDIEDLDLPNRRSKVASKGGDIEWIYWQSGTAHLLPRLIAGRASGPVFLADRLPTKPIAVHDRCPQTGRARLSYRRAAEIFSEATAALANPGVTDKAELAKLSGWNLHQLRHSAITHDAEDGTSTPLLMGRTRHRSVRSLARYAVPSPESIARHVASKDPTRRRQR